MSRLPDGWHLARLDQIAVINPRKPKIANELPVTFLGMEDVSETAQITKKHVRAYSDVSSGYTYFAEGDILVAKITPCFENGKGAYAVGLANNIGFGSTEFHVLRANKNIDACFLYYWTTSHEFRERGTKNMQGSAGQKRVPTDFIRRYKIPLPPLAEQRAIAEILSTWDEAIALVEALIEALQQRKTALMQRLLTGEVRFEGFEGEWEEVRLRDVAEIKGGKRLPKGNYLVDYDTGYPYIRVSNMTEEGLSNDNIMYVPPDIAPLIQAYRIFEDDLYISVAGTIGLVGTVPAELNGANLTENADRLTNIQIDRDYLLYILRSQIIRHEIDKVITQNAQPKLALTRIRDFKIPLPNAEEQGEIATFLNLVSAHSNQLRKYADILQQQKKGLMQRLLTGEIRVEVE